MTGYGPGYGGPGYGGGPGPGGPGYGGGPGPGGPGYGGGPGPGGPGYGGGAPDPGAGGPGITCPDCGRTVPPGAVKLCPFCGYPIMFETPQPVEESGRGVLRKPNEPVQIDPADTGMLAGPGGYQQPVVSQQAALGPHCPACHHRNPARRVRCELCATELWPGAAAPVRRRPIITAPHVPPQGRRFPWAVVVAWVLVAVAAVAVVLALSYLAG